MTESKSVALPTWRIPNVVRLHHKVVGAGEGDRTLATGLGSRGSTTELHPQGFTVVRYANLKTGTLVVGGEGFEPSKS
jgi:hypothetical protein